MPSTEARENCARSCNDSAFKPAARNCEDPNYASEEPKYPLIEMEHDEGSGSGDNLALSDDEDSDCQDEERRDEFLVTREEREETEKERQEEVDEEDDGEIAD